MPAKKNYEFTRAIFHIGCSLILVWTLNYVKPTIFASCAFLLILLVELIRLKNDKINYYFTTHKYLFWHKIIRDEEKNNFSPLMTAALAFLIISWLPLNLLTIAILINALADPVARIFGIKWGKKKILNTKNSFVGSFAFFTVAFLVCISFTIPILTSLVVATVGTVAEFAPDKKPLWVDNLRIPVSIGLVLWILV
ncbi:MAG: hypothetical protein ABIC82_04235 [bacterium]